MRLFVSVNLSESNLFQLETFQGTLKQRGVRGYWRNRDNLHLTLKFLGDVKDEDYNTLHQYLAKASNTVGKFHICVHGLGVFPNILNPRILWAGVQEEPSLWILQKTVDEVTGEFGVPRENRRYVPHLTLASGGIKGIDNSILHMGNSLKLEEEVTEFCLMNSVVDRGIRKYVVMENYLV